MKKARVRDYIFLHAIFLFYCLGTVLTKYSANYPVFSEEYLTIWSLRIPLPTWEFLLLFCAKMLILVIYAVLWREALKRFTLTGAYIQKTVTVIWGLLIGILLFQETLTPQKVVGAVIIMGGLILAVEEHE